MSSTMMQEHKGLAKIHTVCSEMDVLLRYTIMNDLGIDGQMEFMEPNTTISTGHLLSFQAKSGPSYFGKKENADHVKYYWDQRERRYWGCLDLPVVLILHDPTRNLTIYTSVRPFLGQEGPIHVPKVAVFSPTARPALLQLALERRFVPLPETIIHRLKSIRLSLDDKTITGVEFMLASVDCQDSFFELNMDRIFSMLRLFSPAYQVEARVFSFIQRCVEMCWAFRLTEPFEEMFEHVWYELKMVPDLGVPLTILGKAVMDEIVGSPAKYLCVEAFSQQDTNAESLGRLISDAARLAGERLYKSERLGEFPM